MASTPQPSPSCPRGGPHVAPQSPLWLPRPARPTLSCTPLLGSRYVFAFPFIPMSALLPSCASLLISIITEARAQANPGQEDRPRGLDLLVTWLSTFPSHQKLCPSPVAGLPKALWLTLKPKSTPGGPFQSPAGPPSSGSVSLCQPQRRPGRRAGHKALLGRSGGPNARKAIVQGRPLQRRAWPGCLCSTACSPSPYVGGQGPHPPLTGGPAWTPEGPSACLPALPRPMGGGLRPEG